ncbi:hypothetical protein VTK56DRAFT_8258 [Thermocarpiscus australiensis]
MSRTTTLRKYGKSSRRTRPEALFAELPRSPVMKEQAPELRLELALTDDVTKITEQLLSVKLDEAALTEEQSEIPIPSHSLPPARELVNTGCETALQERREEPNRPGRDEHQEEEVEEEEGSTYNGLRVLTWDDVCPPGDRIEKIAEASYAEVYRITNECGTSIIKVVRLESPIKPQTKAQARSGLIDEEPHPEADMLGELQISEWLADIPGFVVYKERYMVRGKATKALLETHQAFHRRMKRKDLDRLQFYPSPSRYLDDTRFLVVELGDAGTALEDFELTSISQVWDIFLHTALALARAEDLIEFEHRDLHEGNLCIRQVRPPTQKPDPSSPLQFGFSGLDITILDYGLSRATGPKPDPDPDRTREPSPTSSSTGKGGTAAVVAYDLEKDLTLFTSTHAPQCRVYRQMRSYLLRGDRCHLPPGRHRTPYARSALAAGGRGRGRPLSWRDYRPYTNVLWLAYLYSYLVARFASGDEGSSPELARFRRETAELWMHLDPDAPRGVLSFPSAGEVVRFAVEAGWVGERQLVEGVWGVGGGG